MRMWKEDVHLFGIGRYRLPTGDGNGKLVDVNGKTALVTGANRGIGLEIARQLAQRGCRVVVACRGDKGRAAVDDIVNSIGEAARNRVESVSLDLAELKNVEDVVYNLQTSLGTTDLEVDYLINNAGFVATSKHRTHDGFDTMFKPIIFRIGFSLISCWLVLAAFGCVPIVKALRLPVALFRFHPSCIIMDICTWTISNANAADLWDSRIMEKQN
eukprot:GABV01008985.1.p1 GENE.GABV01008985.1~~GABV01008985.1.p1  ORF type:complete len:224 (-),score=62.59 GABV01008985.1:202-846(-)